MHQKLKEIKINSETCFNFVDFYLINILLLFCDNSIHFNNRIISMGDLVEEDPRADEDARTIYCANLSDRITDEILYELFLQVKINCFFFAIFAEKYSFLFKYIL